MLLPILFFVFLIVTSVFNFLFIKKVIEEISITSENFIESLKDVEEEYFKRVNELQKLLTPPPKKEFKEIIEEKRDNEIEKREMEEIPLTETDRVPIVEGVKVKFEDEEESFPVDIS